MWDKGLRHLLNFLLYSNLWIACCASAMYWQTEYQLTGQISWSAPVGFVFCATLSLYGLHRLVGLRKVGAFIEKDERYSIIHHFRNHIAVYALLGSLVGAWYFFQLPLSVQLAVMLPALISLGYALPFLQRGRRLRDIGLIKIFLIALTWSWVTVLLPVLVENAPLETGVWLLFAERSFFVFALTLPFDIRDLRVDIQTGVDTIPEVLGVQTSVQLALLALLASFALALLNPMHSTATLPGVGAALLTAAVLIAFAPRMEHDYYFTGGIDGMMLLQAVLVIGLGMQG